MPKLKLKSQHRLLCGDSTDKSDVDRLMAGEKADMVFTDPPYGIDLDTDYSKMSNPIFSKRDKKNRTTEKRKYNPIMNDNILLDINNVVLERFPQCKEIFIFGGDYFDLPKSGSWIVWDKSVDEKYDKMFGSSFELCWSKSKHKRLIARIQWRSFFGVSDDTNSKGKNAKVHPTQKPAVLAEWFFERWGKNKTLIIDLFLGSGSTLIACEKTNRNCYGMEIDPHYCSVIIKRWQEFTGKEAVKA
jgi:DNA modification methylase